MPDGADSVPASSDDFIVIEPRTRIEPRGRGGRRGPSQKAETPTAALTKTVDYQKFASVINYVNTDRMLKAKRVNNLVLFPTAEQESDPKEWRQFPQKSDPPQIQLLFQFKEAYKRAAAIDDETERVKQETKILSEMNATLNDVIREAAEAAEQCRKILVDERRMEIEREKASGGIDPNEIYKLAEQA